MSAISIRSVSKNYGSFTAVDGVDIEVPKGQCFGLLGPNGAGKSTLITMVYGATSITSGEIDVLGKNIKTQGREIRKELGVVPQNNYLDESMTVVENMFLFSRFLGLQNPSDRIKELLDFMSLSAKADAKIQSLSGGMQRRLVFVRALLASPQLVILDEPTTGLDPAVRHLLWEKIRELKDQGVTVLLTTHYMDEAEILCDNLVIMDQGRVKEMGAPKNLIEQHCPGYVARFEPGVDISKFQDQGVTLEKESSGYHLRSSTLGELAKSIDLAAEKPSIMRPSNLEDVFLKVTGKELSGNA